jgi:hypothetical protein
VLHLSFFITYDIQNIPKVKNNYSTPCSRVLLVKVIVIQLVKKFSAFYSRFHKSGIPLGYGLDNRGFESRQELVILQFTTASRPTLRPNHPPIQGAPGTLFLVIKRPEREADHSPPSSAEVKNSLALPPLPKYAFVAWCLVKHRDNYTFTFTTARHLSLTWVR